MLSPSAWDELRHLPGNVRRQIITAIDGLEQDARPAASRALVLPDEKREIRRLRLGYWRIIYLIIEEQPLILGIRRRPPYDYADLVSLIADSD
jgi:mRNA-degrading endonuclease RelE of RelBE toxin-antitoxin system